MVITRSIRFFTSCEVGGEAFGKSQPYQRRKRGGKEE